MHVACTGPISEHTALHFHKRLIWIGSLSIVEMVQERDLGPDKRPRLWVRLGPPYPRPSLPILPYREPPAGAANCCMESDGVLSVMSCLTLPPVEYECAEGDDECRLERQEKKRRATLRKKRFIHLSQFIISSSSEQIL